MAEKKNVAPAEGNEAVARAKDFWTRYNKPVMIACAVVILLGGGWLVYKNFVKGPKESKASEAMFKAEEYFRMDSVNLALNGDGQSMGFLRVISQYGGTKTGNMAHYYAGVCYIKLDDNQNAVKQLEKFSTSSKQIQARAYKLLGDAYADLGQNQKALDNYKKAGRHFEADKPNSAEALFMAAYFADRVMNNPKEAIELYKEVKEKYALYKGFEADMYLARLGVYNVN